MAKVLSRYAGIVIVLSIFAAFVRHEQAPDPAATSTTIVGTWRLATAKYGGRAHSFPAGTTTLKHVTPTQFIWTTYGTDGRIARAAGGRYTLKAETYEETPEYGIGSDFDGLKGKVQTFICRIDGSKWYLNGSLSNGLTIEEVWERVEAK